MIASDVAQVVNTLMTIHVARCRFGCHVPKLGFAMKFCTQGSTIVQAIAILNGSARVTRVQTAEPASPPPPEPPPPAEAVTDPAS